VASFHARADTMTPVIAALVAVAINVLLKIALMAPLGIVGLALATAVGAWVNVLLLFGLAYRRDWTAPSGTLAKAAVAIAAAGVVLTLFVIIGRPALARLVAGVAVWRDETLLASLGVGGAIVYAVALLVGLRALGLRLARS
jgi:putative peptidoglycan lipid II flippase